ncbi:MAG: ferritin [Candidatus Omnitrophota bacterium]|nr:ferritin [Candidatus Omnitrophota bacterium]
MDKKLQNVFNDQIKNELASGYLYLSMAAWFEAANLEGFAHWMKVQVKEEENHAMKMFDFLNDRGVRVVLQAIPQPEIEFSSVKEIFEKTLAHEKKVTALINKLYELSKSIDDYPASAFLQWFITEQVEEEKNATKILETIKMIKGDGSAALIMLDRELAKREG